MYHQVPPALITWFICINDDFPRGLRYSDASFYIDYAPITTVARLFFSNFVTFVTTKGATITFERRYG